MQYDQCPYEKTTVRRDKHTGECHMKSEAETGVMHLQAKECQGLLADTRSEERDKEQMLLQSPQKEPNLPTS